MLRLPRGGEAVRSRRTVNLGERLRARVHRRTRTTGRPLAAEVRFLATVGLPLLSPSGIEGPPPLELVDQPDAEPARRQHHTIYLDAPPAFWDRIEAVAARCAWLRTPAERAWRGGPLLLRGRPRYVSRALRVAVLAGLRAVEAEPALDPAPRARRAFLAALRRVYGDWRKTGAEDAGITLEAINAHAHAWGDENIDALEIIGDSESTV